MGSAEKTESARWLLWPIIAQMSENISSALNRQCKLALPGPKCQVNKTSRITITTVDLEDCLQDILL